MKALVFLGHRGGGPSFTYGLAKDYPEFDHVIISRRNELIDQFLLDFGDRSRVYNLPHSAKELYKIIFLLKVLYHCLFDYDELLITHYSPFLPIFVLLTPFVKVSYVMHDVVPHNNEIYQRVVHWLSAVFFHKIIVLSSYQKSRFRYPKANKIRQIRHPLYHHYLSKSFVSQHFCISPCRCLLFGRIEPYKGLEIISAVNDISRFPILNIVGEGRLDSKLFESVGCRILNNYVPDCAIPSLLESCEYLILAHSHATQSGLFPLAATFGKKIVCFDLEVFREQAIEYDVDTFFVEPGNWTELARKIKEISQS